MGLIHIRVDLQTTSYTTYMPVQTCSFKPSMQVKPSNKLETKVKYQQMNQTTLWTTKMFFR